MHRTSDSGFQSASGSAARRRRARWVGAGALTLAPLLGVASACLDRPIGSPEPVTTNIFVDKIQQTSVDKIDLLFMIDNSVSMSDKQAILQLAVPDLVNRLVNPICVSSDGTQGPPPPMGGQCPTGFSQEFNPINDINIGVVSSSLGDVGANAACPAANAQTQGEFVVDRVDMAHLMGSLDRGRGTGNTPQGFLQWRAGGDLDDLNENFQQMVRAVGENGCGWEASLESWYRFLVDPYPYRELVRVPCPGAETTAPLCVQQATNADGTIVVDQVLLDQRAAFLRPDSLVAVIMLSDENDCSMQVGPQTWVVANLERRAMFRGSSKCEDDANDKCCYSCPLGPPSGCDADPICNATADNQQDRLPLSEDGQNLRCFQQKRRFGVDFLYPTARYVNALSQTSICYNSLDLSLEGCSDANVRQNPLYAGGRSPDLVFFGGIIGVPWQAIQSDVDSNGRPLAAGALRFQDAEELEANETWDEILGDPGQAWRAAGGGQPEVQARPATPPTNPYMLESAFERVGIVVNNINGREYNTIAGGAAEGARDDLQYACIFPLPAPVNCAEVAAAGGNCDCEVGKLNRPLCEENPGMSAPGTTQYWSKAYPGTRHLEVLKGYGDNSIVASICARDVDDNDDNDESDFGYRPAIASIVDRLKEQLGDRCLPRALVTDDTDGTVACSLVETIPRPPEGGCAPCNAAFARETPDPIVDSVVRGQLAAEKNKPCGPDDENCAAACLCEVLQVQDVASNPAGALEQCRTDPEASGVQGWCYVDDRDPASLPLVENCPATQRRILRFVGQGLAPNSTTYVACQGSSFAARE